MKKWISEHVFLIDAIFFFGLFPLTYIAYLYKQELWKNEFIIALFVALIVVERYFRPFIKEKEIYHVNIRPIQAVIFFIIVFPHRIYSSVIIYSYIFIKVRSTGSFTLRPTKEFRTRYLRLIGRAHV